MARLFALLLVPVLIAPDRTAPELAQALQKK